MPSRGEQLLHAVIVDEWEWKFNVWLFISLVPFTLCNPSTHYHVQIGGIAYRDSEGKKVGNLISSFTLLPAVQIR